ncbi:protein SUPPRESSOR OF GENE SILENCING 3-like [Quercus robur]|uniref:protein SUPPRESSOR OF GENE SILENCING 3-like n=1 Tax=Quercus robur TaxID=38942 RepID=UPI0021632FBA|nr:protein SUPPRESSOR OF GENE SILENCING 3-like [Quercus robur]
MADNADPFPKLSSVYKSTHPQVNQLNHHIANINLNSKASDCNVTPRESYNRAGSSVARPWFPQNSMQTRNADLKNSNDRVNAWIQQSKGPWQNNYIGQQPVVSPPLQQGSFWSAGADHTQSSDSKNGLLNDEIISNSYCVDDEKNDNDHSEIVCDSDDDLSNYDSDLDSSEVSYETLKKSKWFVTFFESMDKLPIEEINLPSRQWHCPACKGAPGAIDWYRGLQPLMHHARNKQARRVKLHRKFVEILDQELQRKGTSLTLSGEAYGKWEGLDAKVNDHEIVWPPMVVIMNTRYQQDDNNKWNGMGNQELLDYFSSYSALKARHSYGPKGHRGISVLIFESSASGYLEAARLHKHFKEQGRDRDAWGRCKTPFCLGGKRQLYGYMVVKDDLDIFNQHAHGRSNLKFEMRSYQEMVESKIKDINDDKQQITWFKERVAKEKKHSQTLAATLSQVSEKLRRATEENRIVRERIKIQREENKEEMDAQEQFFKDQIKAIQQAIDAKEDSFEQLQQQEREKVKMTNSSKIEDLRIRQQEIARFIQFQDKEMEQFVDERDKLDRDHEYMKRKLRQRYWKEEVELEKKYETEITQLMEKYAPSSSLGTNSQ